MKNVEEFIDEEAILKEIDALNAGLPVPPPLPELTEDEKRRTGYRVPFREAFGKRYEEILFTCADCGAKNPPGAWEFSGRKCPDCGSRKGATKDEIRATLL